MNSYQNGIQPGISQQSLNEDQLPPSANASGQQSGVNLKAVLPETFAKGVAGATVKVGWHSTPLGSVFVAMTAKGVSRIDFTHPDHRDLPLHQLQQAWPLAEFVHDPQATQDAAAAISYAPVSSKPLPLYVSGTPFQISVWRALLRIPFGTVVSYSQLAAAVGRPRASRAVGNAVGANPVACLIPCHRVIQQSGALGSYRWGSDIKQAIQAWENAQYESSGGW